jgi:hypothetical protein
MTLSFYALKCLFKKKEIWPKSIENFCSLNLRFKDKNGKEGLSECFQLHGKKESFEYKSKSKTILVL